MLDYINYLFHCPVRAGVDSLYAVSPSKPCLWQWPQTELVTQCSQQWGVLILSLFPLPSSCRHSLPQVKLRAKTLPGAVPMIWALFSPSWKHPLQHPGAASLPRLGKGLECFVLCAVWLNEWKLPVFLHACSRQRCSPIHSSPHLPKQKNSLQILLYWYINTVTSAKEPSSHSEAG